MNFPRDHGAHPAFKTEWWYFTGALQGAKETDATGFQLTFFRSRLPWPDRDPGRFAPRQLLFAHLAIASAAVGRLVHEQVAWRGGFDRLVHIGEADTALRLPGWSLRRESVAGHEHYQLDVQSDKVRLKIKLSPGGPPLLQGDQGFSRKGPSPRQASHYYSRPQLRAEGELAFAGPGKAAGSPDAPRAVRGLAWMDHEWSNEVLDPSAAGWDWMGLNLDDGSSLMAFRIRPREASEDASQAVWSDFRWFNADGSVRMAMPTQADATRRNNALRFQVGETWRSPRSNAVYPRGLRLSIRPEQGVQVRTLDLHPLMPDQEVDARRSTGGFYWEGLVVVSENGQRIGQGYLELTGYAAPMKI